MSIEDADAKGFATQYMHSVMQKLETNEHFKETPVKTDAKKVSAARPSASIKKNDNAPVTKYCKFFQQGKCNRGDACRYAHHEEGLRLQWQS